MAMNRLSKIASQMELKGLYKKSSDIWDKRTIVSPVPNLTLESLINYSSQRRGHRPSANKPNGIWYGFGLNWARDPMSGDISNSSFYTIDINDSNILKIDQNNINDFILKYKTIDEDRIIIDWDRVKSDYSGVEINKLWSIKEMYNASKKDSPDLSWYYRSDRINFLDRWDVSSGCIWDYSIINNIEKIGEFDSNIDTADKDDVDYLPITENPPLTQTEQVGVRSFNKPMQYWTGGLSKGRAAGIAFTCQEDNTMLLAFRSARVMQPLSWGFPGGAIEPDESEWEGAKREVEEELGGLPNNMKSLTATTFEDPAANFTYTTFIVNIPLLDKEKWSIILNWENTDSNWFNINSLPSPLHFGVKSVFELLQQQSKKYFELPQKNAFLINKINKYYLLSIINHSF